MQPTRVQDAATLRSGEDSVPESDDSSVTSSLISSSSFDHTSTFAMLQPIPGATSNSIEYDPSQAHPEWGSGYEPDPNGFNDNTFAFNFTSLTFSMTDPTDMMSTIAAAAGQGWDLFANALDPDSSRIVINDPGQGNDLLIGDGLQLVVGATLRDLLKKNGVDITNPIVRKLIKEQDWGQKFLSQIDNLISAQNGPGHMIIWNKTGVMVSAGDNKATMEVRAGNKLYVGDTNSSGYDAFGTGNLQLGYNEKSATGSASLILDEGSYLSVNGFLGGAADKSYAGQSIGSGMENQRTGAVSTQNHVKMDVDGNWGLVGDIRPDKPANWTRVGNNNKINVGGTLGVYMLASMTIGSDTEISVGSNGWAHTGSGVFVGSGGYMSTGFGNRFIIAGGMGAGYMDLSASGKAAQLIIGDDNVIHLTNRNAGIFAAEAGASVTVGDSLTLTGAEISVGYGQNSMDRIIDEDSKYRTAYMSIGKDANISLGYENLYPMANAPSFAEDGVIRLDASNSLLQFGTGLALKANIISLGHYLKDTSNSNFIDSDGNALAEFRVGSNNSVVIGSGANISLGSGIVINENQGYVDLQGGVLNAGYIRMGRYYIENLEVPINGSSYIYRNNSSASIHIGDGYQVSLTQDITIDGSFDRLNIGDNVGIQGNGMYLGDFRGIGSETNHPTSRSLISAGNLTSMTISGDINLNGNANSVMLGSQSLLETTDGNLNIDGINQLLTIGNGGILSAAKTLLQNGSKSIISVGNEGRIVASAVQLIGNGETFTIGDNAGISADRIIIGYRGGSLTIGKNVDFDVHYFDVNVSRTVALGDGATGYIGDTTTVDKTVFNTGNANNLEFGNIFLGDNNKFNVSGSIKGAGINLGSKTSFTAATNASVNFGSGNVTLSDKNNSFKLNDNVTFTAGTVTADLNTNNFILGSNDFYDLRGWNLSNTSGPAKTFTVGNGATGNFGNVNLLGENVTFNTGNANNLEFGNISLGDNNKFNVSGSIKGAGINLGSNTSFAAVTNASVNLGSGNVMLSGTGNNFILNNNVAFTAGTVTADLNTNDFTLGSNDIYDVKGWNLSNSSSLAKTFAVADGATGNFGDVNLTGTVNFSTGLANNLTLDTVMLNKNASINLDGTYVTVHNLDMSNGGVANLNYNSAESNVVSLSNVILSGNGRIKIAQNSEVDIGSLTMDGINPGVIELDNDAVLNIRSINATNVGTDMPTIIIHNGARVIVNGQQITRSSSSNDLIADFNNEANGVYEYHGSIEDVDGHLVIKNFKLDDHLLFENDTGSSDVNTFYTCYKDGILSIIHNDGKTSKTIASFRYDAGDSNQALPNVNIIRGSDGNSYFDITKCFLLGTNILTSKGEKPVESLSVGDEVVAICNNGRINRKIVWIGKTDISVDQGKNKNDLYPVCIKAHAFGLNKPHRDLYLTPEHTVYIDGGLIPVRMLVNGRSIVIDKFRDKFQIYHVETEQHSILLSENLMTESYLNTDDKYLFDNDIVNFGLEFNEHAGHKSWENDAAAPLTVSRSKVEPIWNRLDRRATQLGYKPVIKRAITRNPDLCLITDKGKKIKPVHFKDNIYSFFIPDGTYVVAMNSKTSLPSDVIGPFIDDRRTLGVLVSKISVISNRTLIMFPTDISELSGWHSIEPDRTDRWTMGLAQLPIEITRFGTGKKLIRVELTDTASYLVEDDINEMMKLA
ncbi:MULTISPECIES: Hint domain-containing protein [unclassified Commensalibacter]|uniref:Hint domain-containing protein n=1 Tax=unclassified Commensalibacter TaxID=2630218 RepID=UPI0018DB7CFD|nr:MULTISPECIES: Hint domain-containing protein [unclassified Commensalibacter]MBH9970588.1 Hint domain-containing protein [Commensalibacter sp. M0265]MBH9977935.1 Hint domain-containing protein [Commensalibacter sp. M0266]MBH9993615.1 Hint domain-containing protein [Commensalibacter sp. M0270]MBI0047111.1 Hint domain-containing protein [Commensalibacter sp. M0267]MBI0056780.1 Hint domain-containing protein [Commensalibacter sp. M0268]